MLKPRCSRALGALVLACWTTACGPAVDDRPDPGDTIDDDDADDDDDTDDTDDAPPLPTGVFGIASAGMSDSTSDLQPFLAATASSDVIGLGEAVHTSGGFYALKERLIRALVEEQAVRVLAIETPRTAAQALDSYVLGGVDNGDAPCSEIDAVTAAQTGVFGVFVDDHFISLLMSLCAFNQAHVDDQVRVYGFDAQQPQVDAPAIAAALRAHAPDDAEDLLAEIATCIQTYSLETTAEDHDACVDGLLGLTAYIDNHSTSWPADALATLRIDVQSFASWQDEAFFYETDVVRSYEVRDIAMAAIFLDQQTRFFPDQRVAMWAHDYHLSMAHDQAAYSPPVGAISLGTVLHDELGPRYQAYAISAVTMAINWPGVGTGTTERFVGLEDDVAPLLENSSFEALWLSASAEVLQANTSLGMTFQNCALLDNFSGVFVLRDSPGMNAVFW